MELEEKKSREDGGVWMQNVFCVNHAAAESIAFHFESMKIMVWPSSSNQCMKRKRKVSCQWVELKLGSVKGLKSLQTSTVTEGRVEW